MKTLFTFSFILFSTICFSQKIKAVVLNSFTNEPVEKAHIILPKEKFYTNSKGEFTFNLFGKKSVEITITHIIFETKKVKYTKNSKGVFTIYLDEKSEQLKEVIISSERNLKIQINYNKLENLPRAVYAYASILNKGKIYLFGGDISSEFEKNKEGLSEQVFFSNEAEIMKVLQRPKPINFDFFLGDLQVYDIATKKWSYNKDKFLKRAYHNAIVYKENVYLIGGKSFSKKKTRELLRKQIEIFSLKDSLIALDQTNPHQAVNHGVAMYQDNLLVFGGSISRKENGRKIYTKDVHFYDLKSGNWYLLTTMPEGKEVKGIVFKDKLFCIGGYNKKKLTEIMSFDLLTGKWQKEGDLFKGMSNPSLTKDNEFIYIQEESSILTFNPKTKSLKEYSIDLPLQDASLHYYNEKLYLLGGYFVEDFRKQASSSLFKISTMEFLNTKPTNSIRF